MKKVIAFFLILSTLIIQAACVEWMCYKEEYSIEGNSCCNDQGLIEDLHNMLLQRRAYELKESFELNDIQSFSIVPTWGSVTLMPSTGDVKMLVLPVSYSDCRQYESGFVLEEWEKRFFSPYNPELEPWEQSVSGFYYQQSYGALNITGTVLPVYSAPLTYEEYEQDQALEAEMLTDALKYYCDQGLDISQFDNDGDGYLDAIVIQQLRTHPRLSGTLGLIRCEVNGYNIRNVAIAYAPQLYSSISLLYEHEIGHLMGLLDNYRVGLMPNVIDDKLYELMANGRYINVYYKCLLGWIDPIILTNEDSVQEVELSPVELQPNGIDSPPKALVLIPNAVAFPFTEYYIAEYRVGGVEKPVLGAADLIFDVDPGIVIWHCNTFLNSYNQYRNWTNYLKPIYKSGNAQYSEDDIYVKGDEFSSVSTPNSDFYDGAYTGAYLKVEEISSNKAVLQAGFREPNMSGPQIEISAPTKSVISKGETTMIYMVVTVDGEPFPLDWNNAENLCSYSKDGTMKGVSAGFRIVGNTMEVLIEAWDDGKEDNNSEGEGFIWVDLPAGALRCNGIDSDAMVSEKVCVDNTPPEITLLGENPQKMRSGTDYTELGAIVSDNLDPDIESKLQIDTSNLNINTPGTYTVVYSVTDHAEFTTTAERIVIVEDSGTSHIHHYSTTWANDEAEHWHECECGEKADVASHTIIIDPAIEATCTTPGKTEGSHCSVCGYVIKSQEEIPVKEHSYSDTWSQDISQHWRECTVCHDISQAAAHIENAGVITKHPTEEEAGVKTYACSVCGYVMRTEELPKLDPSHTHTFADVWTSDLEQHWHECECGEKADAASHTVVIDPAIEATCTTPGKTEGSHCSVCGYVIKPQTNIPAKGHNISEIWSDAGEFGHWHECANCDEYWDLEPHAWDSGVITTAPTATKTGTRTYTCTVCHATKTETIPATGSGSQGSESGSTGSSWSSVPTTYAISLSQSIENGTATVSAKSAKKGDTVTITTFPEEGFQLDKVTVMDAKGNELALNDDGGGRYTFTMPASKVEVTVDFSQIPKEPAPKTPVTTLPFTDVSQKAWYYEPVCFVYGEELMNGLNRNTFGPNVSISRAMIVTILYRMEGEPAVSPNSFPDVPAGKYYSSAVAWASNQGIVVGHSDGTFRPDDVATREQVAAILYRYVQYKGYDFGKQDVLSSYTDSDKIHSFAYDAMQWATANGIISGRGKQILDPLEPTTRAEFATMILRLMSLYK